MAIQLNNLVGAHYSLLSALTDKDPDAVGDAISSLLSEVSELKSECDLIPLTIQAIKGDTDLIEERHKGGKKKLKQIGKECDKLRKDIEKYAISEECMAKCNSMIAEIESGPPLPTNEDIELQKATAASRMAEAASAELELGSLKAHLSQLHDIATIILSKIKYITTDEDVVDTIKRQKRDPPTAAK
eukprot:TRINITY_DN22586_c0_g1_i1.p1 TRINITY_DN22586_c0_g1~~TRINITY_DN22586_c0_g1_i1.p1  ORF type:complete len:187 (+),score=39.81 TRINITY_DN22586_c0_g1_i1:65-625(+)